MKLTPYWLDTAEPSGDYRRTPVPEKVDVAIIGAGFTGLSAALEFAKQGTTVAVLDRHTVGWGASGRNGGMATTGLAISFNTAVKRYGDARAVDMFREYNDAIDTIEKLVRDNGINCDFQRFGKLSLAFHPSHYEGMLKSQEQLADLADYKVTTIPKSEIHSEIGSDFYQGAMLDPLGAGLHVGKFVHGLAGAAADAGAIICENAAVTELRKVSGTAHDVHTTRGVIRASQVLVATSGYTGAVTPWLQRRVIPVGSFIIVTEPLPEDVVNRILPNRRQASDSKLLTYYFRITPDNRLLFGGRARFALSSPDSDVKSGKILRKAMLELFPYLSNVKVDYTWGGLVDISMDQMVHAGVHDGVFYSLCYSGHGVQMAAHMGKNMVRYMGGDKSANVWEDLKNPPVPGHFGPPWFLPFIGGAAKIIDRIK
ncbi:NAD(P)/FAD-dependent oxidoreductase [Hoyosella subflava]|uniref:Putative oxidoreductase n=1 Tax=Hoyosella subflava (strain DSM 45089 / JCM 17490 / NBRC 109087 / DQS3-9A1) TaxID=443218 RepID=F6EKX5_HOYSD|nr:FAD-binding oxidoreductase [Hoyosella subflava]AEF41455.1 Putative oxidoreductase [Hoyosella subflava DQS3-9A1]